MSTFGIYKENLFFPLHTSTFDTLTKLSFFLLTYVHFWHFNKKPLFDYLMLLIGLEPTTFRFSVERSTNWASVAKDNATRHLRSVGFRPTINFTIHYLSYFVGETWTRTLIKAPDFKSGLSTDSSTTKKEILKTSSRNC